MKPIIISWLLFTLPAATAFAEDPAPVSAVSMERCLKSGPHFDQMVDAAKKEGWAVLADDMVMAFTPVEEPTAMQGWVVGNGDDSRFEALVGFKAKVGDKPVEGCTIAIGQVDGKIFEKAIVAQVAAKAAGEEQAQDTVYKRYSTRIDGRDIALTISMPRYPNGHDQVVVSLVAEQALEN